MWRRGFGEGARRPRAERGGGGTKRRTQGGKCLGLESSWPHCTRSSTNLEYRLTGRPPDHEDCQHPGIRTTWPSKGRSPSYPERLVLVVVVVVLVALFLPFASGRQTDRDGPSNGPPPLSICIPHRYAKKECLRHPRHPRTEAISLSRNEAFSSTSAFLRNRTPSREGKGTPSRGEWPYQRFLVSRPGKRNWIDGRTGVGAICVEILESPNSREFQHLYPVKTGTEEKGGEGRGEKIGGRDAWIRTRTHRGTRTS